MLDQCERERRGWEWHYLRGVNRPERARLTNPELSMIFGARFGPTGQFLAFTGWDYYRNTDGHAPTPAEVWDFASGHKLHTLSIPGVGLQPAFSPAGRLVALSGSSAPVSLWDITTGKLVRALEERGVAAFSPDGRLLVVAASTSIIVREVASGRLVRRLASRGGRVCFSPDSLLLAQSGARAVELRSASTGEEIGRLPYGPGDQMDLFFPELGPQIAFDPEGKLLVTATSPPRVWDVATRRPVYALGGHVGTVPGVAFGPDGQRIATAGADGTVRLWDAQTGAELAVLRGHTGMVSCVAFHPDGRALISGGRQPGDVKIWDLTRPVEYEVLAGGGGWALAFDEYDRLKRLTHAGRIQTHEPKTGRSEQGPRVDLIQKWISPAKLAAFSGDGRLLAAVSSDLRSVKVFDASTGGEIVVMRGLETLPRRLAVSRDGRRVAAATMPGRSGTARAVRVWDALSGQVLADFRPNAPAGAGHLCGSVALSADGRLVAFDDYQQPGVDGPGNPVAARVRVFDVASSQELLAVGAAERGIGCLAFSPDGLLIAAGGADGRVLVWETATGRQRCDDHLELSSLELAFSPDSRRLAAVNREVVTIWDIQTGKGILDIARRIASLGQRTSCIQRHVDLEPRRTLASCGQLGRYSRPVGRRRRHERPTEPSFGFGRGARRRRAYAWHLGQAEAARAPGSRRRPLSISTVSARPSRLTWLRAPARSSLLAPRRLGACWRPITPCSSRLPSQPQPRHGLITPGCCCLRHDHAGYCRLVPRMIAYCSDRLGPGQPPSRRKPKPACSPRQGKNPIEVVNFARSRQGKIATMPSVHFGLPRWPALPRRAVGQGASAGGRGDRTPARHGLAVMAGTCARPCQARPCRRSPALARQGARLAPARATPPSY